MKTFQNEANTPLITKTTLKTLLKLSFKVIILPTKITIWWRHFRNTSFIKMKLSKNSFYKSWDLKLIFSNEIFFRKICIIFNIETWLWNFVGLITLTENVQKNFQCNFCNHWSISFILKSFYQTLLTLSKTYQGSIKSPGYPLGYIQNIDWTWVIQVPNDKRIRLGMVHLMRSCLGSYAGW